VVDRLQRRGLLAREPDPQDRRVIRIALTPAGADLRVRVRAALHEAITQRFPTLIAADPARFAPLAELLGDPGSIQQDGVSGTRTKRHGR
jgi:DNA-binding MarR family transcriptional regulator